MRTFRPPFDDSRHDDEDARKIRSLIRRFLGITNLEIEMSKIQDAVARNQASTTALLTSIQTEIQQLAATATDNGDDALADALNKQSDQLDVAKGQLDADDPAAPPAPPSDGGGSSSGDNSGEPQIHNVGP